MNQLLGTSAPQAISVSELNRQSRHLLEVSLGRVWVVGEISNFSRPSSGHWYFTLKDKTAQVRCAMFRNRNQSVKPLPKEGDQVIIEAKASIYEGRGDYQLIVNAMQGAGLGVLQQRFEQLKEKLKKEGLFEAGNKQPLPLKPRTIGVITSPTGAAIHDILSVCKRRFTATEILLYPSQVQGEEAKSDIVKAIALANEHNKAEVLIVGRGGGSIEDLWSFNEEIVARAIFDSRLPIISAVGHETDFTIADFVADWRAPTPSAAAEHLTPNQMEIIQAVDRLEMRLIRATKQIVDHKQKQLVQLAQRLKTPQKLLLEKQDRLNLVIDRLHREISQKLQLATASVEALGARLASQSPQRKLKLLEESLSQMESRLHQAMNRQVDQKNQQLGYLAAQLQTLSPLNTVARGYSILRKENREVASHISQIKVGEKLTAHMNGGEAEVEVKLVKEDANASGR